MKYWIECVCLMIYETKEMPDLNFSNQTRFDLKSINGKWNIYNHCTLEKSGVIWTLFT